MTAIQRYFAGVVAVAIVALLSWLTVSPGTPQIYAPLNLLVLIPVFWSSSYIIGVAVVPMFYCLWCWPILRGGSTMPTRSLVLLALAVGLSAASLLIGYRFGIRHHSSGYVVGVVVINFVCWGLLGVLALLARRRHNFVHNLGFHTALFAWLAWCAFSYLGELP